MYWRKSILQVNDVSESTEGHNKYGNILYIVALYLYSITLSIVVGYDYIYGL